MKEEGASLFVDQPLKICGSPVMLELILPEFPVFRQAGQ